MNTASRTADFTQTTLLQLLTAQYDLDQMPGERSERSPWPNTKWISYPASRVQIEETIKVLIRSLATAHGIAASYPPT